MSESSITTQALLLADDSVYRTWLAQRLAGQVTILPADSDDAEGLADEVAATPGVSLVFVEFNDANAHTRAQMVRGLLERYADLAVVAVGGHEAAQAVLTAMRAGASDFLVVHRDDEHLSELVARVLRRSPRTAGNAAGAGRLYALVSGAPSPGLAFLATHVALALQQGGANDPRVLLVDLTVPGGAALVFLDTDQTYSALDALRDVNRCDQTLIDTAFTRYRGGLYLLILPEDHVGPPVIDADSMGRLLDIFIGYFDTVVVAADTGISLPPLAAIVTRAKKSLLLTDQSVLKSRQNKQFLHALRQSDCPLRDIGMVIDHYQPQLGLEPERLAELLDLPFVGSIAAKSQTRIEAMNSGEPMFEYAPKDPYCREVMQMLEYLTGTAAPVVKRGLLGRFFE